ncbi:lipase secretion chaperone [Pseudoalteromonas ostreae]|uniref:lipase secretion chaperone n=1 Tax=Pseudoalteromonas ostreae TaxID=2774154 RepID=UPI001B35B4D1|nr:lipase secretion chaperone [Pseudoalteromonas ostreae]
MKRLLILVLVISITSTAIIFLLSDAKLTSATPPHIDPPMAIDSIFEHVILASQESDEFSASQALHQCEKLVTCKVNRALFERYLSFKITLAELQQQIAHLPLSEQLIAMIAFQQRYFSAAEIALLFNDDNEWQHYTIAKLEINQNNHISDELKQQLLSNLEGEQPERIIRALKPSNDLKALNTELKDALQQQDYNQLAAEFGDAAATRLIALEQQRRQWQTLSEQLTQQIKLLKQHYEPQQAEQKITQLLDEHLTANQKRRFLVLYPLY